MNNRYFIATSTAIVACCAVMSPVHAITFPDVQEGTELGDAIYALANKQIINGYPDGEYKAHLSVTRGQVAKIIANTLQLNLENTENPGFQDISTDHLFYPYIAALTNIGVFNGSASHFYPDKAMTRAEVAKVLTVAFDLPSVGQHPFHDVNDQWAYYINALYSNGVTTGVEPTLFGLNSPVTRGQLALFIQRLQTQLDQVKTTFTSAQFDNQPIAASIVHGFGHESTVMIETKQHPVTTESTVTISPKNIGSAYVHVGAIDPLTNEWVGTPLLYQFTTSLVQGKLQVTKELQTTPLYTPVQLPIYDGIAPFSFTYVNGQPVSEQSIIIESKRNEFDGEQEHSIWLKNIYGELLVSYTNKDGQQKQKAVFIEQKPFYLEATVGEYVTNSFIMPIENFAKYGITDVIIDSKVFEGQEESPKVKVEMIDGQIAFTPRATGDFIVYLVDSQYRLHPITLRVQSFGQGYLLQFQQ